MERIAVYMDVCCLNRPFDNQSQHRVYLESEAILSILSLCKTDRFELMGSDTIEFELAKNTDTDKYKKVRNLYSANNRVLMSNSEIFNLSDEYRAHGIKPTDSLHLATAVYYNVNAFLTTDDSLLYKAQKLGLQAFNPVNWLMEVTKNGR